MQSLAVYSQDFLNRLVTDSKAIKKFDKEFKKEKGYEFYMPEDESSFIDTELVLEHYYTNAKNALGTALLPIFVAVNPKDENMNDPELRVHGRPIDGRQRWQDSKLAKVEWPVAYLHVKDMEELLDMMMSMGSRKSPEVEAEQNRINIERLCKIVWKKKGEEITDGEGSPRKENVAKAVYKRLMGRISRKTVYKYVPKEYMDEIRVEHAKVAANSRQKKISQKDIRNQQLETQLTSTLDRLMVLELNTKPISEKTKIIIDLKKQIKRRESIIGDLKKELKSLRRKLKIDETDKQFEQWWSRYKILEG